MKREIKFRAWDKENNKFLDYPKDLRVSLSGGLSLLSSIAERDGVNIHKIELMQYTGLKDKNGKEIYEGDIITHSDHPEPYPTGVVEWDEGDACFTVGIGVPSETTSFHEVIGNIYEHPHLLE